MTTSNSKGRFFLQNESIRIDSLIDSMRELECSTTGAKKIVIPISLNIVSVNET